jgi:rhamnosyltransferase
MTKLIEVATKRLGIYCIYDKNGVVGSFIPNFLHELTQYLTDLVVVVNGKLTAESRSSLEKFTKHIVVRENKGLDAAAYRQILLSTGWEKLAEYDEVICLNDTILGPVYPFSEMFQEMNSRDVDFWGITTYSQEKVGNEFIPTHLQAYWHAYRRSLVMSQAFHEYWENFPELTDYAAVTHQHEIPFTKHFERLGFKWSSYIDCNRYADQSPYPLLYMPTDILRDQRCPIFKRRVFFLDYSFLFNETAGQPASDLYRFLKAETNFDTNLLWDSLLPNYNISDIHKAMHLNYVLPTNVSFAGKTKLPSSAFIFHAFFMDLLPQTFRYLTAIPDSTDLVITTPENKVKIVEKYIAENAIARPITIIPVKNRGRDVSALFVAAKDVVLSGKYEVVGFAHDKKSSQNLRDGHHGSESQGFGYELFENTLASRDFVTNVIQTFADEPRLGLLTPPPPIHGLYFAHTIPSDWGSNFENTKKLLKDRLSISVPLDPQKPTVSAMGSCYWFRSEALRPLFAANWSYEDFLPEGMMGEDGSVSHAIERANGYVAQSQGFYPAWVMSDRYASIEITSLWHSLSRIVGALGPRRRGESLLGLENWTGLAVGGLRGKRRLILSRLHRVLQRISKRTVRNFPKPLQEIIYRTIWTPVAMYRKLRRRVGDVIHKRPAQNPEIEKLTQDAVSGNNGVEARKR